MYPLKDVYVSSGAKFFHHQEAMIKLRNGIGQPIVTHVMLTDVCNHSCAFCSVHHRVGDSLPMATVVNYLGILREYGLKAVILSGGGNPILYKCKETGSDFNDVVDYCHRLGLEIGLITNGMPLKSHSDDKKYINRRSWKTVKPSTLDKLTWIRISMAGLDHTEDKVYVPDVNPAKTTLGFSYVAHDIYHAPEDEAHGKVSTEADVFKLGRIEGRPVRRFEDRIEELERRFVEYCIDYEPRYLRLLPNCLEPNLIPKRCGQLQEMADRVNHRLRRNVIFVQNKPPKAPKACYLGYIHPVLNCDGYCYPCDSCVLNEAAGHQFANPWRICHWSEIGKMYEEPVRSLIADPGKTCPGCVFSKSNAILGGVVEGNSDLIKLGGTIEHVNFP